MTGPKTITYYDSGAADRKPEDGAIEHSTNVFGVIDAFSEPHCPEHPLVLLNNNGQTGGQFVRDVMRNWLEKSTDSQPLKAVIAHINQMVYGWKLGYGLTIDDARFYSGASFAVAKVFREDDRIEIAQGGDCVAIVRFECGGGQTLRGWKFQSVETDLRRKIAKLMLSPEIAGNRDKMWNAFYYDLCDSRRDRGNHEYPIFDGRPELMDLIEVATFTLSDIEMIVFATDGAVPWDENPDWLNWSDRLIRAAQSRETFETHMEWVRTFEIARNKESHETNAEATIQAVFFNE
ncbi:MAG: hypothetical protein Q8N69_01685 [bacterium]|nr:hypothetical protein [bacterium]